MIAAGRGSEASLDAEAPSGHVESWVEHDAAVNAAWAAPGVRAFEDDLVVDY